MSVAGQTMLASRYTPYPRYRDSGVDWLGEIPAHWEVIRLRSTIAGMFSGVWGEEPDGRNDVPCVRVADFDRVTYKIRVDEPTLRSIDPRTFEARSLRFGDLLLEKSGGGEHQPVGAVVLYDYDVKAVCSNFIAVLRPAEGFCPRYLSYLHASLYTVRVNTRSIKQSIGIQNLDVHSYLSELVAFPPLTEQRAIAAFLDRETAKIDALVEKKGRLIELLQEKRSAIITQAVTKGLNPNVPMKDSGVDWLEKIPAHWEIRRLKIIASIQLSNVDKKSVEGQESIRLCNYVDVYYNDAITSDLEFMKATATKEQIERFRLFAGDVIITKDSETPEDIAVPAFVQEDIPDVICGYHLALIRPVPSLAYGPFLARAFSAINIRHQFCIEAKGITRYGLTRDAIGNAVFPVPPIEEQRAIADFLDRETAKIDALIAKIREGIERLKEYRTALITAAVTGKIDVRHEVDPGGHD